MQANPDPRPVVVAVDHTDSARHAAAWAADVAADWSAPLHLLHVVAGDPQDPPSRAPSWLAELAAAAERGGARPTTVEVLPGTVIATVAARGVGARLVVLGSYGKGAFSGMLAGGVAIGIVERVACPVAVVRGTAPRIAPPRGGPVVVGVDGSGAGEAALAFAADLAVSLGARLVAVYAWSDVEVHADGGSSRRHATPASLVTEGSDLLEARLAPVLQRYPGLVVERQVVEGTPLRTLIDRVPEARALVVGARGNTGQRGMPMGSTTHALLEFAPCPVVVVHGRQPVSAAAAAAAASEAGDPS